MVLSVFFAANLQADEARDHLNKAANAYRQLKSFQVESVAEKRASAEKSGVRAFLTMYAARPDKIRVETKDSGGRLQSLLISDGAHVTEYRAWANEYTPLQGGQIDVTFSPERGVSIGEMLYDTVANGVRKASVRGRQTLEIGSDSIPCVVIDVEYEASKGLSIYSFWIAEDSGLILRRAVTFGTVANTRFVSVVSTVRALTINEEIQDSAFDFKPSARAPLVRIP